MRDIHVLDFTVGFRTRIQRGKVIDGLREAGIVSSSRRTGRDQGATRALTRPVLSAVLRPRRRCAVLSSSSASYLSFPSFLSLWHDVGGSPMSFYEHKAPPGRQCDRFPKLKARSIKLHQHRLSAAKGLVGWKVLQNIRKFCTSNLCSGPFLGLLGVAAAGGPRD